MRNAGMSRSQLIAVIRTIANNSLSSANQHNPFISKPAAMHGINEARLGKSCPNAIVLSR